MRYFVIEPCFVGGNNFFAAVACERNRPSSANEVSLRKLAVVENSQRDRVTNYRPKFFGNVERNSISFGHL